MIASFLSALTIGLMITCIISVLIIVILSYQKNMFNKQVVDQNDNQNNMKNGTKELSFHMDDVFESISSSRLESESTPKILEHILFIQGVLYCIVNIILLGKWVRVLFIILCKISIGSKQTLTEI